MKKTIFVFLLAMGAFIANAQNETKTPGTDDRTQTETPDKSSTNNDINNSGKTSTSEMSGTKLMISDLPKSISESLSTQHQGWIAEEVYKVDYEGAPAYKVKVRKGQESKFLVYDANGKLLKTKDASHKSTSGGSSPETETR